MRGVKLEETKNIEKSLEMIGVKFKSKELARANGLKG